MPIWQIRCTICLDTAKALFAWFMKVSVQAYAVGICFHWAWTWWILMVSGAVWHLRRLIKALIERLVWLLLHWSIMLWYDLDCLRWFLREWVAATLVNSISHILRPSLLQDVHQIDLISWVLVYLSSDIFSWEIVSLQGLRLFYKLIQKLWRFSPTQNINIELLLLHFI